MSDCWAPLFYSARRDTLFKQNIKIEHIGFVTMIGTTRQSQEHLIQKAANNQHQHLVNHRTSNANQQHNADDDYQDDHGMRVGNNYQAEIPQFIAYAPAPEYYEDEKAIRVWSPNNKIPDHVLDEFINKAKEKFFYNTEQALGMLSWHKFDLNRAYADLPNFVPYPNEWSVEDKVLFEQAYQFHEKQFNKIRQMLPDKSMAQLISYYYSWKKTRTRASLMERQTRRFAARKTADSNGPSDDEEAEDEIEADTEKTQPGDGENGGNQGDASSKDGLCDDKGIEEPEINCSACRKELRVRGQTVCVTIDGVLDNFCPKCYLEWKDHGGTVHTERELGDCFYHPIGEQKRILFSFSDVLTLVEGAPDEGDNMLKQLDAQIQMVKRDIQTTKQTLSRIDEKIQPIANQIADLNIDEFSGILPEYRPTKEWSSDEIQLVIQGLRRYGTDFSAISDVVRTKSADTIRIFFVSQNERLGLSLLVSEFERNKDSSTLPQTELSEQPTKTPIEEEKSISG